MKVIGYIFCIPFFIIISPVIIVLVIIETIKGFKPRKAFKFLEDEGFIFFKKRKPYSLYWRRNNICILHQWDSYQISFDYDSPSPTFLNIYDSEIGSIEERERLNGVIFSFQNAHPRDKMEGYPDIHTPHVEFIKKHIQQIILIN